jgi:hypothetical protein
MSLPGFTAEASLRKFERRFRLSEALRQDRDSAERVIMQACDHCYPRLDRCLARCEGRKNPAPCNVMCFREYDMCFDICHIDDPPFGGGGGGWYTPPAL